MLMLCFLVMSLYDFFFFKQKTAYEMRISDWSSDVCSSDLYSRASHQTGSGSSVVIASACGWFGLMRILRSSRAGIDSTSSSAVSPASYQASPTALQIDRQSVV